MMTIAEIWQPLLTELDRWAERGKRAVFWLRDDDAVAPTQALDHLLDLADRFGIPTTLAVIPSQTKAALARRLDKSPLAQVALHGWSHSNHAPKEQKKQELGPHRAVAAMAEELRAGLLRLARLHKARVVPMLVPPWNRIDAALLPRLQSIGVSALSVFGPEEPSPVCTVNTHVDLIDWKGSRGGRDTAELIKEIVGRMRQVEQTGGATGILTHHLVHDEQAWLFLEQLFDLTARHAGCDWAPISRILQHAQKAHEKPATTGL